ncbi:MAG: SufE family protein [Rhodanobacter sp.]
MNATSTAGAEAAQQAIAEEFAFFGDWTERYQYLIDIGKPLGAFPDHWKTDKYRITGCQSMVWLVPSGDAANLHFEASSDSAIVSGLLALILRVYSDRPAQEILDTPPQFIAAIGLARHLSPTRANGLAATLDKLKSYATAALH